MGSVVLIEVLQENQRYSDGGGKGGGRDWPPSGDYSIGSNRPADDSVELPCTIVGDNAIARGKQTTRQDDSCNCNCM